MKRKRWCSGASLLLMLLLMMMGRSALAQSQAGGSGTVPPATPERLVAADFECKTTGYRDDVVPDDYYIDRPNHIPNGWEITYTGKTPVVDSTRIYIEGGCVNTGKHVEKISGEDSMLLQALDIEWTGAPGKPFDASLYQQVAVISGADYSLSGWFLTLCGGSNTQPRNDCPEGYYMAKQLGIDPIGGVDPQATTVQWVENRRNFVAADGVTRIGWQNLRLGVTAQAPTITVFARIVSPFQWHGNHGFIDALSLVQAPTATLTAAAPLTGSNAITLTWDGSLGPDIPLIPSGTHTLLFDVQYWHDANQRWRDVVGDVGAGTFVFGAACPGSAYRFRVQPRAEQPEGSAGAWPNQRYPGVWSEPVEVYVPLPPATPGQPFTPTEQIFLPAIANQRSC